MEKELTTEQMSADLSNCKSCLTCANVEPEGLCYEVQDGEATMIMESFVCDKWKEDLELVDLVGGETDD